MFEQYAYRFSTVENNSTFYRFSSINTVKAWRYKALPGFVFAMKANRYSTHMKKLKDAKASLGKMFSRFGNLKETLGPALFQLTPEWRADVNRLESFYDLLPSKQKIAFEFRDPSWYTERVHWILSEKNRAMCLKGLFVISAFMVLRTNIRMLIPRRFCRFERK